MVDRRVLIILVSSLFLILILPMISASWWNPFTWFDKTDYEVKKIVNNTININIPTLNETNNIIIDNKTLNSMLDYFRSYYPNESLVMIYGEVYNNTINIKDFKGTKIISNSGTTATTTLVYQGEKDYLGTIHLHPTSNIKHCKLSSGDVDSYNKNRFIDYEIDGIICNDMKYLVLFYPNYTTHTFIKYVYKIK